MASSNNPHGLQDKQWQFVQEYLVDLDGAEAYVRAGYKAKTKYVAYVESHKLLKKPKVFAALAAERARLASLLDVTPEKVLAEYAKLAFSDMRQYVTWSQKRVTLHDSATLTDAQAAAVAEVSETVGEKSRAVRFKLHDKKGALDSLAKHFDLFHEQAAAKELGAGLAALLAQAQQGRTDGDA